jgi:hypothetical protein
MHACRIDHAYIFTMHMFSNINRIKIKIFADVPFRTLRDPKVVMMENDPYDRVYKDLPSKHLVLIKVPICEYCGAIRIPSEGPSFCCRQGKVNIVNTSIPDELRLLFTEMRCILERIFGISTHISLSLALEPQLINGLLLLLVNISSRFLLVFILQKLNYFIYS